MRHIFKLLTLLALTACELESKDDDWHHQPANRAPDGDRTAADEVDDVVDPADPTPANPPNPGAAPDVNQRPQCVEDAETWRRLRHVRNVAGQSVHELITCGGAQMGAINSMVFIVILSNAEFFDDATIEELTSYAAIFGLSTDVPFTQDAEGRWQMPINDDSSFEMNFYEPGADVSARPVRANVFDLESYLVGANIRTRLSWEEMKADPSAVNTYTLTWTEPGPLSAVLFPDGAPAERQVEVHLSIIDFLFLAGWTEERPDFGPFAHLGALVVDSVVDLVDERDEVAVRYAVSGQRARLDDLTSAGQLNFELKGLSASDGDVELIGETADLAFPQPGALAGRLVYRAAEPAPDVRFVDDFGTGASYPTVSAWCPDEWAAEGEVTHPRSR